MVFSLCSFWLLFSCVFTDFDLLEVFPHEFRPSATLFGGIDRHLCFFFESFQLHPGFRSSFLDFPAIGNSCPNDLNIFELLALKAGFMNIMNRTDLGT